MNNKKKFDLILQSKKELPKFEINNLAEILFNKLPNRDENSTIIISHINEKVVEIKLKDLRKIVTNIYEELHKKNIKTGDTVLLTTLFVNNELLTALMFTALTTYGVKVFFPMFVETSEIKNWLKATNCKFIILPKKEIYSFDNRYNKEKKIIDELVKTAEEMDIYYLDIAEDFNMFSLINERLNKDKLYLTNKYIQKAISDTNSSTDSVIFTTAGTTGRSKLVIYEQGAFIRNCYSWQASGMYDYNALGGRSFIDVFTHTISVRTFFNALWTGNPICIVTSDWILKSPQKIILLLSKMKPETVTLGPSSIDIILESVKLLPETRDIAFSNLRTIVSTGATYNKKIAKNIKEYFGITMHNAYGTSETQQVLTTLLDDVVTISDDVILGKPFAGVSIGLEKYENDLYKLYVKSPFGHKYCIDVNAEKDHQYPEEFFYTGDIVRTDENNRLFFIGRENRDFFNTGYGLKVPIFFIKKSYKILYEKSDHIEYFPAKSSKITYCNAALIFIYKKNIPPGIVKDKRIIKDFTKYINDANNTLKKTIEPFEFEHRTIKKFLLINSKAPRTKKKNVSSYIIEKQYKNEINLLKTTINSRYGVKCVLSFTEKIYNSFLNIIFFNNVFLKKIYLKFISFKHKKN